MLKTRRAQQTEQGRKPILLHSRTHIICVHKHLLLPSPTYSSTVPAAALDDSPRQGAASTEPQRIWLCPGRGTSTVAMAWQSPAGHLHSPHSALRGAEQSCSSLDICHATRASPLPIRPPTHLHPSPVQTLLAINKQWKCQPVPGKSPRQLYPIQQAWEQLPQAVLVQGSTKLGQVMARNSPALLWFSGQCLACVPKLLSASPQHQKHRCPHDTQFNVVIRGFPSFLTFLLHAFVGKLLLDTKTQLDCAQMPKLDVA